jgi:hypothetical protein
MTDTPSPDSTSDAPSAPASTPEPTTGTGSTLAIGCVVLFVVLLVGAIVAMQLFG